MSAITRGEIQDLLNKFSGGNPRYREQLLKDPKAVIEKQFNTTLPAGLHVKAIVEAPDTIFVVVPYVPKQGAELSDNALEMVAGGFKDNNCNNARGGINTHVEVKLA